MKNGSWGDAINIGKKLNIEAENIVASISPDGKYLFFNSMNGNTWDIYWVDADIIEELK
jgi:Tol biopolymer transport system component